MAVRFSQRTLWQRAPNSLWERRFRLERSGAPLIDLTVSNPTAVGLPLPPPELWLALGSASARAYAPEPRGSFPARAAVSAWLEAQDSHLPPDALVLTASTSEAYAWLFKLLADGGDEILVPEPCYPLFSYLAELESVSIRSYPLHYAAGWRLDVQDLVARATDRTRAVVVVNPGNPTGHFLQRAEASALDGFCAERGLALISDEVFASFPFAPDDDRVGCAAAEALRALTFSLSGLSKVAGLPQLKLGWIGVGGPDRWVQEALGRLEVIADTYLSVGAPAQAAASEALRWAPLFQAEVLQRVRANREALLAARAQGSPWSVLDAEGGWSAVLRLPDGADEEEVCTRLLDVGVVVQPGYFFDFPRGKHLVVSLLPEPAPFSEALRALAPVLDRAG